MTQGTDPMSSTGGDDQSTTAQVKDKVQQGARQLGDQVQQTTQQAKGQVGGRVREQVDQRSTQVGEQASSVAEAMRRTSSGLREEGQAGPARIAEQAAERTERVGAYLKESDADRILRDAEDFARRQPWVVVLGGVTLGLIASRFLKASSTQRYESTRRELRWETQPYAPVVEERGAPTELGYVSPAERTAPPVTAETPTGDAVSTGLESREER